MEEFLTLFDIGARGGAGKEWDFCCDQLSVFLFEPDKLECSRMNNESHNYAKRKILPYALGDQEAVASFYVTENDQCCSLLRPNLHLLQSRYPRFSKHFLVKNILETSILPLDKVIENEKISKPDVIKIDVQGAEKLVLDGAENCLSSAIAVRIESHLREVYVGETLFGDMIQYFHAKGFELRKIINDKLGRFRGEIVEVDAIFFNTKSFLRSRNPESMEFRKFNLIKQAWDL